MKLFKLGSSLELKSNNYSIFFIFLEYDLDFQTIVFISGEHSRNFDNFYLALQRAVHDKANNNLKNQEKVQSFTKF